MKQLIVAIIGRPNVGKSSLINRLLGQKKAIVHEEPGVTRDPLYANTSYKNKHFTIVDTGGIFFDKDPFSKDLQEKIEKQVQIVINEADLIILMVDIKDGLTPYDRQLASQIRKAKKDTILAANKADNAELELNIHDFYHLSINTMIPISAIHGKGISKLLDEITSRIPEISPDRTKQIQTSIAIVGKPNVGKSSLLNAIIGKEKVLVDDKSGTTRDAIDISFKYQNNDYLFIDTAGLRKKSKIYENIEYYSILRAIKAIQRSDIVILVIDAQNPATDQDKKIASICLKEGKSCLIVVNKWDLIEKDDKTIYRYEKGIRKELWFLDFVPMIFISALTKKRVSEIFDYIQEIDLERQKKIPTRTLTNTIHLIQKKQPAPRVKGKRLKISYATQTKTSPPTFSFFVNNPLLLTSTYERYLKNSLRDHLGQFLGTPLFFHLRKK